MELINPSTAVPMKMFSFPNSYVRPPLNSLFKQYCHYPAISKRNSILSKRVKQHSPMSPLRNHTIEEIPSRLSPIHQEARIERNRGSFRAYNNKTRLNPIISQKIQEAFKKSLIGIATTPISPLSKGDKLKKESICLLKNKMNTIRIAKLQNENNEEAKPKLNQLLTIPSPPANSACSNKFLSNFMLPEKYQSGRRSIRLKYLPRLLNESKQGNDVVIESRNNQSFLEKREDAVISQQAKQKLNCSVNLLN